jgi:hypothetical protein
VTPLKAEIQAVTEVLNQPHDSAEAAAKAAIIALDLARAKRITFFSVFRFGVKPYAWPTGFGPFATKNQALKAIQKHPAVDMAKGLAVVPCVNEHGLDELIASTDVKPEAKGDWVQVRMDAEARRNGWDGVNATRQRYL